jgi:hypothetical protein
MDWDRVRSERLTRIRGWEGVDADHSGGDGPLGTKWDEPYWPSVPGGKLGDLYRSRTARPNADGETDASPLVVLFDTFVSESKDNESLEKCTDQELHECRDTCRSILNRVSGLTWSSDPEHKGATSIELNAAGKPDAIKNSSLIVIIRIIYTFSKREKNLYECTDSELQRFHDICQTTIKRVALQFLNRETVKRLSR